jgi:hypothetical protein
MIIVVKDKICGTDGAFMSLGMWCDHITCTVSHPNNPTPYYTCFLFICCQLPPKVTLEHIACLLILTRRTSQIKNIYGWCGGNGLFSWNYDPSYAVSNVAFLILLIGQTNKILNLSILVQLPFYLINWLNICKLGLHKIT